MTATAEIDAPATIEATFNYIDNNGEKLFTYTGGPGSLDVRTGGTPDPRRMTVHNGRLHADRFVLEQDGFRFIPHDTKVRDFFEEDEVRRVYYAEMEALVKAESGARRVVVFDHTLRTADDELREKQKIREVVRRVHNDYTEWSGPQRVRDLLPDEAEDLLTRRFAIIQVWRPPARDLRRAQRLVRRLRHRGAALSQSRGSDLRGHLQSGASLVLVPAHAARRGACVQGLRFAQGRTRALDGAHRVRGSDLAPQGGAAREH